MVGANHALDILLAQRLIGHAHLVHLLAHHAAPDNQEQGRFIFLGLANLTCREHQRQINDGNLHTHLVSAAAMAMRFDVSRSAATSFSTIFFQIFWSASD